MERPSIRSVREKCALRFFFFSFLKTNFESFLYSVKIISGVEDNGKLAGLSRDDMKASLKTLRDMAARLGATTNVLRERSTHPKSNNNKRAKAKNNKNEEKRVAEVLIRKIRKDDREECVIDLRLAVMGGQDAGKSTLLGLFS